MYCFTPYTTDAQLKKNAENFSVELIEENAEIYRTVWKITRADGAYTYTLCHMGYGYTLVCDNEYEKFMCNFSMLGEKICIENGEYKGKKLKAKSRLKIFSQIVMCIWGLIKVGKID